MHYVIFQKDNDPEDYYSLSSQITDKGFSATLRKNVGEIVETFADSDKSKFYSDIGKAIHKHQLIEKSTIDAKPFERAEIDKFK